MRKKCDKRYRRINTRTREHGKTNINKIKIIINNTIKKLDKAKMEEIKNLEEIRIEIAYKKKELDTEMKMLENEENKVKNIIEEVKKLKIELRFMKRCKILNTELDELFLLYKYVQLRGKLN